MYKTTSYWSFFIFMCSFAQEHHSYTVPAKRDKCRIRVYFWTQRSSRGASGWVEIIYYVLLNSDCKEWMIFTIVVFSLSKGWQYCAKLPSLERWFLGLKNNVFIQSIVAYINKSNGILEKSLDCKNCIKVLSFFLDVLNIALNCEFVSIVGLKRWPMGRNKKFDRNYVSKTML